jgi:iron(III) transport system substrate-binding protein
MTTRRDFLHSLVGAGALGATGANFAVAQTTPANYPSDYADLIARAKKEGRVAIYTSTDEVQGQPLVEAFKQAYGIAVDYNGIGTTDVYNRVISESAAGQLGADVSWTSSMDLQMVLASKGLLDTYKSPEAAHYPSTAIYKDMVYGTSIEPVAMLYNKNLLKPEWVPKTRADLVQLLKEHGKELKGKVASFDPEKSGIGFLLAVTDNRNTQSFWELAKGFGAAEGKVYGSSGAMREKVVSGEQIIAFNVIGSYALQWAKDSPAVGVSFASDYTAAFQRVASVNKGAPHPAAGRLFLDFMLSEKGQAILAGKGVPPLRQGYKGPLDADEIGKLVGSNLKIIPVDEKLADNLNPKMRAEFFQVWKKAMRGEG